MNDLRIQKIGRYTVGYTESWLEPYIENITEIIQVPAGNSENTLGGRRKVPVVELAPGTRAAVKHYARGGLLGHFVKETYLKWGKARSRKEFEWLQRVRLLNIRAPEPLAFVFQGRRFSRCWLLTGEIEDHETLADYHFSGHQQAENIMADLASQVGVLISNKILHVDLHPGNVLIDPSGLCHIIDFDKARWFWGGIKRLSSRYLSRWQRAVLKHRLDPMLVHAFEKNLHAVTGSARRWRPPAEGS
jgi:3-deoxy-D-manno-octulosonic acid kinase